MNIKNEYGLTPLHVLVKSSNKIIAFQKRESGITNVLSDLMNNENDTTTNNKNEKRNVIKINFQNF